MTSRSMVTRYICDHWRK